MNWRRRPPRSGEPERAPTHRERRWPAAWLLVLVLVAACGSRSTLTERGHRSDGGGGGGGGGAVGSGGTALASGGSTVDTGGSAAGGRAAGTGGGGGTGGDVATGGASSGGSGGSCSGDLCLPSTCGDGELSPDEECDDGNLESDDECTELCRVPTCGDGFLRQGEACDDGNTASGDACPADCGLQVLRVAAYGNQTCALLTDRRVKCWGANSYGQLGLGDTASRGADPEQPVAALPFVDLGTGRTAQALSMGWYHVCALLDGGSVKCWGLNNSGQLGLEDLEGRGDAEDEMGDTLPAVELGSGRSAQALGVGGFHSCVLLDDASVKCWGGNSSGQLGLGDVETRGDAEGEMGNALQTVRLGSGRSAQALGAGAQHACALLDDSSVKCWGGNSSGQLGLGDTESRGDEPDEMDDALPAVDLGSGRTAKAVMAGSNFSCAVLDDDSLKCWGANSTGVLGLGDAASRGGQAGEMGDALRAVDLGAGRSARTLSGGLAHACAVLDDASVKCWGWNAMGQLGLGNNSARGDGPGEMGDALPSVALGFGHSAKMLATGSYHSCALLEGGLLKCWGMNGAGQLGLDDHLWRGEGPGEMGDDLPLVQLW